MTVLADTGFLMALNQPRDSLYPRAAEWATSLVEPIVVTEYVLWELLNGLSKPEHRESAHETLHYIDEHPHWEVIPASGELYRDGLELHRQRNDKAWSLTDCISFLVMKHRQIVRALTSDTTSNKRGSKRCFAETPIEVR